MFNQYNSIQTIVELSYIIAKYIINSWNKLSENDYSEIVVLTSKHRANCILVFLYEVFPMNVIIDAILHLNITYIS